MKLTIDASVFVARFVDGDVFHDSCLELMQRIHRRGIQAHAPALVFAEVAGAVSRICQNHVRGDLASLHLQRLPWLRIRPLDMQFGLKAAALASRHLLRGADSTYVAVARETRTTLTTLDEEMLALDDAGVIAVMKPLDWLRLHDV